MEEPFEKRKAKYLKAQGFGEVERKFIGDRDARMRARFIYDSNGVTILGAEKKDDCIKIYTEVISSNGIDKYPVNLFYKMFFENEYVINPEKTEHECPFTKNRRIPKIGGIPDKHMLAAYWCATEELTEICEQHGFGKIKSHLTPNIPSAAEAKHFASLEGINPFEKMDLSEEYRLLRIAEKKRRKERVKKKAE